jgi:hypothetical protein
MTDLWFYAHDDNKIGPCSAQQLKELAASGRILPTDTVWKEGVERGVPARKVRHLFPTAPAGVPPAQAPPPSPLPAGTPPSDTLPPARPEAARPAPDVEPNSVEPGTGPADSTPATAHGDPAGARFAEGAGPGPVGWPPATRDQPAPQPQPDRKLRAVGLNGATIVSQDGTTVKFRKKCTVCRHEDRSWGTMRIRMGSMQVNFFCTKCRKTRRVEIRGSVS